MALAVMRFPLYFDKRVQVLLSKYKGKYARLLNFVP